MKDVLVCIKVGESRSGRLVTIGKKYEVVKSTGPFRVIINDVGFSTVLQKDHLVTVDEYRDMILKEMGI